MSVLSGAHGMSVSRTSKHGFSTTAKFDVMQEFLNKGLTRGVVASALLPFVSSKLKAYPKVARVVVLPLMAATLVPAITSTLPSAWSYTMTYLMSSIVIPAADGFLLAEFKDWLEDRRISVVPNRSVTAQSQMLLSSRTFRLGVRGMNMPEFSAAKVFFEPRTNFQMFTHKSRLFFVTTTSNKSDMMIWTAGWTPAPIKELLDEIMAQATENLVTKTRIFVPDQGSNWIIQKTRNMRSLDSVYLPAGSKDELTADIKEYLSEKTRQWYADRGIPYRRGYLLHGAPGTGKSSLAVALAGNFSLDVFSLSLLDPNINDSTLANLFQDIPPRCLVLLEDVDSAGLGREVDGETEAKGPGKRAKKKRSGGVTLSGLLNAIDGSAAPEGHLLVMSTNCPAALDEALVRAGRVDVRVEFKYADVSQIREIFLSMYKARPRNEVSDEDIAKMNAEVSLLADGFVPMVPEYKFSPAQLQDYFLLHKDRPQDAVDKVAEWVKQQELGKFSSGTKIEEANAEAAQKAKRSKTQATEIEKKETKTKPVSEASSSQTPHPSTAEPCSSTAKTGAGTDADYFYTPPSSPTTTSALSAPSTSTSSDAASEADLSNEQLRTKILAGLIAKYAPDDDAVDSESERRRRDLQRFRDLRKDPRALAEMLEKVKEKGKGKARADGTGEQR